MEGLLLVVNFKRNSEIFSKEIEEIHNSETIPDQLKTFLKLNLIFSILTKQKLSSLSH